MYEYIHCLPAVLPYTSCMCLCTLSASRFLITIALPWPDSFSLHTTGILRVHQSSLLQQHLSRLLVSPFHGFAFLTWLSWEVTYFGIHHPGAGLTAVYRPRSTKYQLSDIYFQLASRLSPKNKTSVRRASTFCTICTTCTSHNRDSFPRKAVE
jgi:hypothetical protein